MTKKKPDSPQCMTTPTPLNMAPASDEGDVPPMSASVSKTRQSDDDIPWGEVILEPEPHDQPKPEAPRAPIDKTRTSSSRATAVAPPQPSMAARERVLARTAAVKTDDARPGSDSPHTTAVLDDFGPSGYPPVAVMVVGLTMVLLLLFLTGRN